MSTLNLVVIRSPDLDWAALFYHSLGLQFARHHHGSGPEHLACELGSAVFEIYPRMGDADSTASTRIGFKVPSLDATVLKLQEIGVRIVSPPKDSPWGRRAVVDDFDGHRVELTEADGRARRITWREASLMGKVSNLNNIPWKKALLRMRIIWFALVVGPCAFMVVVIPQIQHHHNPALKPQPMLPWIHVIVFAVVVPTAFFVRRWIFSRTPWPDGIRPSAYYVGDIVFWAACEGVVYMGLVFAVVNGTLSPTIYPSAAALFLQVITFPTGAGAGVSAGRPAE